MSAQELFTDELRSFVLSAIRSVEQLELLLLVRNANETGLTAEEANALLRSNVYSVSDRLRDLERHGLLRSSKVGDQMRFRYEPSDESTQKLVQQLTEAYLTRRFSVIELMYSTPQHPAQGLADAFRISGKGGKNG